jgi:hypothetical protein
LMGEERTPQSEERPECESNPAPLSERPSTCGWYEETEAAQLSMYQPNPDFREPQEFVHLPTIPQRIFRHCPTQAKASPTRKLVL